MKFGQRIKSDDIKEKEETMGEADMPSSELRGFFASRLMSKIKPEMASRLSYDDLVTQVYNAIGELATAEKITINAREQRGVAVEIANDMVGLGPIQQLLDDETITDIMVVGPKRVYVDKRGRGRELTGLTFRDTKHLNSVAQRIARNVGRKVDESSPLVDARLVDGSRVNIVFEPIALDGCSISIRKFPTDTFNLDNLVGLGSMPRELAEFLKLAAKARLNIIISGGTGSGKTTLLNSITEHFSKSDRIVTIEDAAELKMLQDHVVRLETRHASGEGAGGVTQTDLVKNALRMNPDRVVIGEVRGGEAFDLLQAMNTGHDGSLGTLHANTPRDALGRLENMVLMAGYDLPAAAIRGQIASAVDLVVQVEKMRDRKRRVVAVSEITGMEGGVISMIDLFKFRIQSTTETSINGAWEIARVKPSTIEKFIAAGIDKEVTRIFTKGD